MKKDGMHLYQHVQDHILDMISKKKLVVGDRIPAEKDLSEQMQVSRLTVRKAYAALAEAGIVHPVQGRGTFVTDVEGVSLQETLPAGKGPMQEKKVIGVIFPEVTTFFGPILKGIEEVASETGFTLNIMLNDNYEREENALATMEAKGVSGIIINPRRMGHQFDDRNYQMLVQRGIPAVMVGKPPIGITMDCVMCDDVTGSYKAVQRLVEKGHRRIMRLFMSGDDAEALVERKDGYEEAMQTLLPEERQYQLDCILPDWREALLRMVAEEDITAVVSDSDGLAVQASIHLSGHGIAKPEIGDFITYNGAELCRQFHLNMTTIEIPKEAMGRQAMFMLKEKLNGSDPVRECARYSVFQPIIMWGGTES